MPEPRAEAVYAILEGLRETMLEYQVRLRAQGPCRCSYGKQMVQQKEAQNQRLLQMVSIPLSSGPSTLT